MRLRKLLVISILFTTAASLAGCTNAGNKDAAKANKLIQDANRNIKQIDKLERDSQQPQKDLDAAAHANNVEEVKRLLDQVINMIEAGLKLGATAADRFEQAAQLQLNEKVKSYLDLVARSLRKKIDAFKETQAGARAFRDVYGTADKEQGRAAIEEFRKHQESAQQTLDEAEELADKADRLAADNPSMIQPAP